MTNLVTKTFQCDDGAIFFTIPHSKLFLFMTELAQLNKHTECLKVFNTYSDELDFKFMYCGGVNDNKLLLENYLTSEQITKRESDPMSLCTRMISMDCTNPSWTYTQFKTHNNIFTGFLYFGWRNSNGKIEERMAICEINTTDQKPRNQFYLY